MINTLFLKVLGPEQLPFVYLAGRPWEMLLCITGGTVSVLMMMKQVG